MNDVGVQFIEFIKSFPTGNDFDAKDVKSHLWIQTIVLLTFFPNGMNIFFSFQIGSRHKT